MRHEINTWPDTLLPSLLGFCIVFLVLVLIMVVIYIMSVYFRRKNAKSEEPVTAAFVPSGPKKVPAKGSLGELKLYDTPDKTAALAMAIVADKIQKPLNEIRFVSIRRIND